MTKLIVDHATIAPGRQSASEHIPLVNDASLQLSSGEVVALLGANGGGKTSLLRGILGFHNLTQGTITLDDQDFLTQPSAERAQKVSYLPQQRPLAWPSRVYDIVALGRFAHGATLGRLGSEDIDAVEHALTSCDLQRLKNRNVLSLSGGERARVHFARAMATQAPLLIADEPMAELDPRFQLQISQLIRQFVDTGGGALVVLHEIALAANLADRLIWMRDGHIIATGTPAETLTPNILADVYGVRANITRDEHGFEVRILSIL